MGRRRGLGFEVCWRRSKVIFLINYVEKRQHDRLGDTDNKFLYRSFENYQV